MNKRLSFVALHQQNKPLLLANPWDQLSARIFEQAGFQALGTTSRGIANAHGRHDGERLSFGEMVAAVKPIIAAVAIPVSVDLESGYGATAAEIADNLLTIADLGAQGVNLEDSPKPGPGLRPIVEQQALLEHLKNALVRAGHDTFYINARIDTYLQLPEPLADTLARVQAYDQAGADGVFVPGLRDPAAIAKVVAATNKPVNLMSLPDLTDLDNMAALGVRRFSLGNAFSDAVLTFMQQTANHLRTSGNTAELHQQAAPDLAFAN